MSGFVFSEADRVGRVVLANCPNETTEDLQFAREHREDFLLPKKMAAFSHAAILCHCVVRGNAI
jgi:hypothetical protein